MDMQKDTIITKIICSLGYFYLVERDNNAQKFIITKKTN